MKRVWAGGFLLALLAGAFFAGAWATWTVSGRGGQAAAPHAALYYACPMHPQYHSDRPGECPSCGMRLEPVYAEGAPPVSGRTIPAGALTITPEKQQTIGITTGIVERTSMRRALRTVGRIAPDENRVYRLVATIDGWTKQVYAGQSGSIVARDQLLLTFYSREFLAAQAGYFYALEARERFRAEGRDSPNQMSTLESQVRTAAETLQALGMDDIQLAEITRTRKAATDIAMRSPTAGFIVTRNVYPRQRFDRGVELYRIVDISRVWVLADVFEGDAQRILPGTVAHVSFPYQERGAIPARVSDALPQFDPATRTLKIRLETDNPGYLLRPDMLVDVSLDLALPEAVTVPADAIVDSGSRKTVFVDRGSGYFEPRRVETGWRIDDRIEITRGLMAGERIVLSGNFLLDSESRMKMAATGLVEPDTDPVCGMDVDRAKARSAGHVVSYQGRTYYFCSNACTKRFEAAPTSYVPPPGRAVAPSTTPSAPAFLAQSAAALPERGDDAERGSAFPQATRPRSVAAVLRPHALRAAGQPETPPARPAEDAEALPRQAPPELPPGAPLTSSMDPACRIMVDEESAAAAGLTLEHRGTRYFFASTECRDSFRAQPALYVAEPEAATPARASATPAAMPRAAEAVVKDPVCGMEVDVKTAVAAGLTSAYKGKAYYFCSDDCKKRFDQAPAKYAAK
jgi:membrane fusion protein, copper/silver efflux system